jgi:hypothetical protein
MRARCTSQCKCALQWACMPPKTNKATENMPPKTIITMHAGMYGVQDSKQDSVHSLPLTALHGVHAAPAVCGSPCTVWRHGPSTLPRLAACKLQRLSTKTRGPLDPGRGVQAAALSGFLPPVPFAADSGMTRKELLKRTGGVIGTTVRQQSDGRHASRFPARRVPARRVLARLALAQTLMDKRCA